MSSQATIVLGIALAYLVLSVVVGLIPGKKSSKGATGFVAGDRTLGLLVMYFITGATVFSAFAFLGGPGWAYSRGASAFYILGYGALGFVPFYFLAPRASRLGKAYGFVTQAEMVGARYGQERITRLMAVLSVLAFVPYLALQIKGAGFVLSVVSEGKISPEIGGGAVYLMVLVYVLRSGVLGVGWTNTFQGLLMMLLAWGLGLYLPHLLYGGVGAMFEQIAGVRPELLLAPGLDKSGGPWPWSEYSSAVIVSIIGLTAWPHLFMKSFSAASERILRLTAVLYPTFQVFLVPLFLIGFAGVLFDSHPDSADKILPHILMNLDVSPILVGLFCAGALAASMSSGDAMVHASASILVRDGFLGGEADRADQSRQRGWIRGAVVLVMILSYVFAVFYQGSLVGLLLTAYGAVVQFMPAMVATLYWRKASGGGVFWGLLSGGVVTAVFAFGSDLRPWPIHAGAYGLAVNVCVLVAMSWRASSSDRGSDRYLEIAAQRGD